MKLISSLIAEIADLPAKLEGGGIFKLGRAGTLCGGGDAVAAAEARRNAYEVTGVKEVKASISISPAIMAKNALAFQLAISRKRYGA